MEVLQTVLSFLARTEWLVGAAVAGLIVTGLIVWGKLVTISTHREQLDAERARADRAEEDAAAEIAVMRSELNDRMTNFRADHAARMEQSERLLNLMLTEARRYADDWKATAHITAENAKISEDRMDEVLEGTRLVVAVVTALKDASARHQITSGPQ